MTALLKLIRPKQYTKNVFVFAALLFTRLITNPQMVLLALGAFATMCLLGSATYIVNDIVDVERDRAHPKKRLRPIASGQISVRVAWGLAVFFLVAGVIVALAVSPWVLMCGAVYLLLQVVYNLNLKHVPIADVFVIAAGFVIRVVIGTVALNAALSGWILLCTAFLALLLGFGKRRSEFLLQGSDRGRSRESLTGYTIQSLDAFVVIAATASAMCYGIYSIESSTARQFPALIVTTPFVVFGVCRYLMILFSSDEGGEPESLVIKDRPLLANFACFLIAAIYALSGAHLSFLS